MFLIFYYVVKLLYYFLQFISLIDIKFSKNNLSSNNLTHNARCFIAK